MPNFAYSARSADGQTVQAELNAATRRDALRILKSRGLTPLNLTESAGAAKAKAAAKAAPTARAAKANAAAAPEGAQSVLSFSRGLNRSHRLNFLTALHDLTSGGMSAGEAVHLLAVRVKDPNMRMLCAGLWERISEGATVSRALSAYPQVFDENTINLIEVGEATGNLNEVLVRVIAYLTEQKEMQRQLAAALAYPAFLSVVAGGVVLFFLFFLLPRLKTLFASLRGQLPLVTRVLIGVSEFMWPWGFLLLGAAVFGVVSFFTWRRTEEGRRVSDGWLLRLPVAGEFFVARTVLAFSQNLSVLLENGITTADALRMTEKQVGNRIHRAAFNEATDRVLEGEALSKALTRTGCFPDLVLDQLAVAENTGNLAPGLRKIAANFQKIVSSQLTLFTKLVGTGVLLTVFVFVGFIAYAIVSAVFQLSASINQ